MILFSILMTYLCVYGTFKSISVITMMADKEWYEFGEDRACLCVYGLRIDFCPSSLPLGVGGWLRLMIVALPELFY